MVEIYNNHYIEVEFCKPDDFVKHLELYKMLRMINLLRNVYIEEDYSMTTSDD